jgi:hypothetical protein
MSKSQSWVRLEAKNKMIKKCLIDKTLAMQIHIPTLVTEINEIILTQLVDLYENAILDMLEISTIVQLGATYLLIYENSNRILLDQTYLQPFIEKLDTLITYMKQETNS